MTSRLRGVVAMDGPSGTGKSTVSRRLARECGAAYLDTGAMYRAVTLAVLRAGLHGAEPAVVDVAVAADLRSVTNPDAPAVLLDGEDVEAAIRGPEVTRAVSAVSAQPAVRGLLVAHQRRLIADAVNGADRGGIVVEGRDIGSVVAPDAKLKVYLTASEEIRATRRESQDRKAGRTADGATVLADVRRRDRLDSTRKTSPLHAAADALVLDTDELSVAEVLAELLRLVRERGMVW